MSTLTTKSAELTNIVWPGVGEYGVVPIDSLVPNPNNPRKHFDPDETESLALSIRKGGKREITTVRLLTSVEKQRYAEEYPNGRYMITSGGRRHLASLKAGLATSEIRVKEYGTDADEELDMYMLNEDRIGLSDLENAWAVDRLRKKHGWDTIEEIAENVNKSTAWVHQTLSLLKCIPEVQAKLHPSIKYHVRMRRQVGIFLARRPAEVQRNLIQHMPAELKTSPAQLAWLHKQVEATENGQKSRARNPKTMRSVLEALGTSAFQRANHFNHAQERFRLFDNTSDSQAAALAAQLRRALNAFQEMVDTVEKLAKAEKRISPTLTKSSIQQMALPVQAAAQRPISNGTRALSAADVIERRKELEGDSSTVTRPKPAAPHAAGNARLAPRPFSSSHPAVVPRSQPRSGRTVNAVYEFEPGKFKGESVSLRRFMELWDAKKLEFQVKGEKKPSHYPDRSQLAG